MFLVDLFYKAILLIEISMFLIRICICSAKDLKDYMRQAGEVTYADAHKRHKNEG